MRSADQVYEPGSIGHIRVLQPFRTVEEIQAAFAGTLVAPKDYSFAPPIDTWTPRILEMWRAGVGIEVIAESCGKSQNAIWKLANRYKAKRPDWHMAIVKSKAARKRWLS